MAVKFTRRGKVTLALAALVGWACWNAAPDITPGAVPNRALVLDVVVSWSCPVFPMWPLCERLFFLSPSVPPPHKEHTRGRHV